MKNSLDFKISYKKLFVFALPTILANVFMSIYSTVDGIFVANYVGTDALSAVNIVMPFVMIVIALGTMIGTGGSAIVSALLGEDKEKSARGLFSFLSLVCVAGCSLVSVFALIFQEPLLRLLGANDAVFDYCILYSTPLFYVAPLALLGMALQTFFISAGKPTLGMIFSVMGGIVNVFLDWLLIGKLGMETTGAGLATGIGYTVPGLAGLLYFIFARKGTLYFVKPEFSVKALLKTLTNGSSEMVAIMASGITTIMMNNIVIGLVGEDGVAAISILIYAMTLLTSIYMGYSMGVAPVMSFHYGAKNTDKLKRAHKIHLVFIAIFSVTMFVLGIFAKDLIISIFAEKGTDVYKMAYDGYFIFSISFLYMGFNLYSSSLFTSLGDGKTSAFISFFRGLIFLAVALAVLPNILGLDGLWLSMPAAEFLGLILSIFFLKKEKEVYHYA